MIENYSTWNQKPPLQLCPYSLESCHSSTWENPDTLGLFKTKRQSQSQGNKRISERSAGTAVEHQIDKDRFSDRSPEKTASRGPNTGGCNYSHAQVALSKHMPQRGTVPPRCAFGLYAVLYPATTGGFSASPCWRLSKALGFTFKVLSLLRHWIVFIACKICKQNDSKRGPTLSLFKNPSSPRHLGGLYLELPSKSLFGISIVLFLAINAAAPSFAATRVSLHCFKH